MAPQPRLRRCLILMHTEDILGLSGIHSIAAVIPIDVSNQEEIAISESINWSSSDQASTMVLSSRLLRMIGIK